jgi:hypothetical protein
LGSTKPYGVLRFTNTTYGSAHHFVILAADI